MQYSRRMESQKRQNIRLKAEEEQRDRDRKRMREEDDDDDDHAGRSLRRRKPVNYTEKDDDISDLFDDKSKTSHLALAAAAAIPPAPVVPKSFPRLTPDMPPLSDISDASDEEVLNPNPIALSPLTDVDGIAVSKVIDPSKGLLKLKIKRAGGHSSTPPHPMVTPQHTPSHMMGAYHSPQSLTSPIYSPHSSHSLPQASSSLHYRSKSSSGSDKESKHKKSGSVSRQSRAGSSGIQDISDPDEPLYEIPPAYGTLPGLSSLPQLYSPGGESSGSDSNPHRKALKLKLKLTPKDSTSEGEH